MFQQTALVSVLIAAGGFCCAILAGCSSSDPGSAKLDAEENVRLLYLKQDKQGKWECVFWFSKPVCKKWLSYTGMPPSPIRIEVGQQVLEIYRAPIPGSGEQKLHGALAHEPRVADTIRIISRKGEVLAVLSKGLTDKDIQSAKKGKLEEALKEAPLREQWERLRQTSITDLNGSDGKLLGQIVELRLRVPAELNWNTPEGGPPDWDKGGPMRKQWEKLSTILVIRDQLYFSKVRYVVTGSKIREVEEKGKKRVIDETWPMQHYWAVFLIPGHVDLRKEEWHIYQPIPSKVVRKLDDLKGRAPDEVLKVSAEEAEDLLPRFPLQAYVDDMGEEDVGGVKQFRAEIRIRTGGDWESYETLVLKRLRWGTIEPVGELVQQRKSNGLYIQARFPKTPEGRAPVFVQIEGIEGWIRCKESD